MSTGILFHTFNGLKPPPLTASQYLEPYLGEPCLHHAHGVGEVYRDGNTHACLSCFESIEKGHLRFSLSRLKPEVQKRARVFWNKVDIRSFDECWQWTAEPLKGMGLSFFWRRPTIRKVYKFHSILVAAWLTWGDIARTGTISLCGQRRCVNPLHQIPATDLGIKLLDLVDYDKAEADLNVLKQELSTNSLIDESSIVRPSTKAVSSPYLSINRSGVNGYDDLYSAALIERNDRMLSEVDELLSLSDKIS